MIWNNRLDAILTKHDKRNKWTKRRTNFRKIIATQNEKKKSFWIDFAFVSLSFVLFSSCDLQFFFCATSTKLLTVLYAEQNSGFDYCVSVFFVRSLLVSFIVSIENSYANIRDISAYFFCSFFIPSARFAITAFNEHEHRDLVSS